MLICYNCNKKIPEEWMWSDICCAACAARKYRLEKNIITMENRMLKGIGRALIAPAVPISEDTGEKTLHIRISAVLFKRLEIWLNE